MYGKERSNNMIGDIRKFRFWCQKVLPLVYDDSLSYYEILCKVVHYLNKVIEDVNSIPDYIDAVIEAKLDDEHLRELIEQFMRELEDAISSNNEGYNTNSSADYNIGQLLWWKGQLYKVIRKIDSGDTIIVGTNIELMSFEDLLDDFMSDIKKNICANDEGASAIATSNWNAGTWLWLNDVLYKAISDIDEGNAFVITGANANVEQITVETEMLREATARANADSLLDTAITNEVHAREDADTALNEAIADEVGAREDADTAIKADIGTLTDLNTTDKSNLVAAINEVNRTGGGALAKIGDLNDLTTTNKDNLVSAINELRSGDIINYDALDTRITALESATTIYYNVKDYGAVGDGVTDDTAAINTAVNLANTTGGIVFFPRGQYYVTDTIRLTRHGTGILGENSAGTYIFVHHNGPGVVIGDGINTIPSVNVQHIGIFNYGTSYPDSSYGLFLNNVVNGFVSDVIVGNFKRCFGLNHAGNTYLYSCAAVSNVSAAIGFFVYNHSVSSSMDNCIASFSDGSVDNGVGLILANGDIADFSVKYFDVGNGGYGIYIDGTGAPAAYPPADIRLYDCVLDGQRNACIYVSNINQRGNVVINGGWLNPLATADNKCVSIFNSYNTEITNCTMQQLAESTPIIYGVFANSAVDTTITNCRFINVLGVYLQNATNGIINSNSFTGYNGVTSAGYDIASAGATRMVVNGNNSRSNMSGFLLQSSGDIKFIITNNSITNKSGTAISGTDASSIETNNITA